MYGNITTFTVDMATGDRSPEVGEELEIRSPMGRSVRGYVVESTRSAKSEINPNRFKLRIRHVPLGQLHDDAIEIVRYGPGHTREDQRTIR